MNDKKIKYLESAISHNYGNIAGIVAMKDGETVYENCFNGCTGSNTFHVYSVTKSIFSVLFGIAIHKGYIKSIEQKVLEFFPDYKIVSGEEEIWQVTLKDMLTMTAPYKYGAEPYEAFFTSEDWVKFALDLLGGDKKSGDFRYSAIVGSHILSGVLSQATGRPILDFAVEHLFAPLEISVPRNIVLRDKEEHIAVMNDSNTSGWVIDPQGINTAGWGLFLSPVDMAKIGLLYLNNGRWNGEQIVPTDWVLESTKEHSRWGDLPYGYLWWIIDEGDESFAAMGDGGNVIYINRKKNLVVSIAAYFVPEAGDMIELIKTYIEPILEK